MNIKALVDKHNAKRQRDLELMAQHTDKKNAEKAV